MTNKWVKKKPINPKERVSRYPPMPSPKVQPTDKMKRKKDRKGWRKEVDYE